MSKSNSVGPPKKSRFPYGVLVVAPSLDIMGGQAVQAELLIRHLRECGVRVAFVPHNPRPPGPLYFLTKIKYLRTVLVSFFYIGKLFWNIPRYNIIHIFSASYFSFLLAPAPALVIARCLGRKTILNYRSGQCRDHLARQGKIVLPLMRLASKIVVPSEYLVREFADFGLQAEAVYNLVNMSEFEFRPREVFRPNIIVARNLEKLYNIPAALRAFQIVKAKYPQARLTLLGSGSEENMLKNLVAREGIADVNFCGRVERSEISALYQAHDVFLNSSDIDNMPVSLLEAYASGLAVVTTNAGGIPYICENNRTGILVEKNDHRGLAAGIIRIIEDGGFGRMLTENARKECRKFAWSSVSEGWQRIYQELHNGKI